MPPVNQNRVLLALGYRILLAAPGSLEDAHEDLVPALAPANACGNLTPARRRIACCVGSLTACPSFAFLSLRSAGVGESTGNGDGAHESRQNYLFHVPPNQMLEYRELS